MNYSVRRELRLAFPAWAVAVLLPAPAMLTGRNGAIGLMYFFLACMGLVAEIFSRDAVTSSEDPRGWCELRSQKLVAAALALLAAWVVFAAMCLTHPHPAGAVAAALGLLELVPAICVVPYLTAIVGNPFMAVVLSLTLVTCMKLLGCIVVVLVYGWDASERGYTAMPWMEPNLLVWAFFIFAAALSAICYWLGERQSRQIPATAGRLTCERAPQSQLA